MRRGSTSITRKRDSESEREKRRRLICFMFEVYTCSTLQILKQILPHFPPCLSTFLPVLLSSAVSELTASFHTVTVPHPQCHITFSSAGKTFLLFFPPLSYSSLCALALSCLSPPNTSPVSPLPSFLISLVLLSLRLHTRVGRL